MTEELKDQRIVTMMSPGEVKAIDDWSFKNRIRSRGEAIRRLCQMGIILDDNSEGLSEQFFSLHEDFSSRAEKIAEMLEALPAGEPNVSRFTSDVMALLIDTVEKQQYLANRLALVVVPASRYRTEDNFDRAHVTALTDKATYAATFLETKVRMYEARRKYETRDD